MSTLQNIWENLDWSILYSIIPALLCITLHELAHGFVAYRLGDPTAKRMGRLTLNPLRHLDFFGFAMMVFFRFGWAIFNLIPIPPLDGSKVLFSVISDEAYEKLMRYERFGMIALLLLVSTDLLGQPLYRAASALYGQFFHIAEWAAQLVMKFM